MTTIPANSNPQQIDALMVPGIIDDQELHRLQLQSQMVTNAIGGVLPEQPDTAHFKRVLDIGCGTGEWLLEVAQNYPNTTRLIGIDINPQVIEFARNQARSLQVDSRVEFHQMDALGHLEFPNDYFDLVHEGFAISWLHTWEWPSFLTECQRVAKPGAVIRVTEGGGAIKNSSPAFSRLFGLFLEAFHQEGYIFTSGSDGLTRELSRMLKQHGLQNVQTIDHVLEYGAGTPEAHAFAENCKLFCRIMPPLMQKWTSIPDDFEETRLQMIYEQQQPDYVATVSVVVGWGTVPLTK